eukprot:1148902-Pelagomonas_calceolata.AAC.4
MTMMTMMTMMVAKVDDGGEGGKMTMMVVKLSPRGQHASGDATKLGFNAALLEAPQWCAYTKSDALTNNEDPQ